MTGLNYYVVFAPSMPPRCIASFIFNHPHLHVVNMGFIGRFEYNRELWRKGKFRDFLRNPVENTDLSSFEGVHSWVLNFSVSLSCNSSQWSLKV
jgi:hypothetical protein